MFASFPAALFPVLNPENPENPPPVVLPVGFTGVELEVAAPNRPGVEDAEVVAGFAPKREGVDCWAPAPGCLA